MADPGDDAGVVTVCLAALSPTFVTGVAVGANGLFPSVGDMASQGAQPVQGRPGLLGVGAGLKHRR